MLELCTTLKFLGEGRFVPEGRKQQSTGVCILQRFWIPYNSVSRDLSSNYLRATSDSQFRHNTHQCGTTQMLAGLQNMIVVMLLPAR